MPWIDITGSIQEGMWSYGPHLPQVSIKKIQSIEEGKHDTYSYILNSLTATYLETAAHYFRGARSIDQLQPKDFILDAVIIKLQPKAPLEPIRVNELEPYKAQIKPGDALLIATGWDENWNKTQYTTHSPHFTLDSMQWVVARKVALLGADIPCFDNPEKPANVNSVLFKSGALLLAPVVNLIQFPKERGKLYAFPLKIVGVCATPCRALIEI